MSRIAGRLRRFCEVAIGVVVVGSVVYGLAVSPLVAAFRGLSRELGGAWLVVFLMAAAAVVTGVAGRVGPVWATGPELTWLDPLRLVRRRRRLVGAAALVGSAVAGVVVAVAAARSGSSGPARCPRPGGSRRRDSRSSASCAGCPDDASPGASER